MIIDVLAAGVSNPGFDVDVASRAYLATLQGAARAQSDAYFEGGYWLTLWGALVAILIDWLLLRLRLAHAFRAAGERMSRRPAIVTWITAVIYTLAGWLLTLPWTLYAEFFRERQYDLMSQSLAGWFGEALITLGLSLAIMPLAIVALYAVIRRFPRGWWLWGTGLVGVFALFGIVVAPVYVAPLFNTYTEMQPGPLRSKIEGIAARYDIPAQHIYVFDASKQTKRISANVSGLGPTIRISLNDNLLIRTSEPEILAVLGHEMGHYKLGHVWIDVGGLVLIFGFGFFLASRIAPRVIARHGRRWGVRDLGDPASLPLLAILSTAYLLLATPLTNTLIRVNEAAADAFGLDAAREPDGFAQVAMRLSEYRKIEPSPLEEALFFDHPSGATRVRGAMEWKKDHVAGAQVVHPPAGYLTGN